MAVQSVGADKGGEATSVRDLTLTELLRRLEHHSNKQRGEAVAGLVDLIGRHPVAVLGVRPAPIGGDRRRRTAPAVPIAPVATDVTGPAPGDTARLVESLCARLNDSDDDVRRSAAALLETGILPHLPAPALRAALPRALARCHAAATSLRRAPRLAALAVLAHLARRLPDDVAADRTLQPCLDHLAALLRPSARTRSVAGGGAARLRDDLEAALGLLKAAAAGGGAVGGGAAAASAGGGPPTATSWDAGRDAGGSLAAFRLARGPDGPPGLGWRHGGTPARPRLDTIRDAGHGELLVAPSGTAANSLGVVALSLFSAWRLAIADLSSEVGTGGGMDDTFGGRGGGDGVSQNTGRGSSTLPAVHTAGALRACAEGVLATLDLLAGRLCDDGGGKSVGAGGAGNFDGWGPFPDGSVGADGPVGGVPLSRIGVVDRVVKATVSAPATFAPTGRRGGGPAHGRDGLTKGQATERGRMLRSAGLDADPRVTDCMTASVVGLADAAADAFGASLPLRVPVLNGYPRRTQRQVAAELSRATAAAAAALLRLAPPAGLSTPPAWVSTALDIALAAMEGANAAREPSDNSMSEDDASDDADDADGDAGTAAESLRLLLPALARAAWALNPAQLIRAAAAAGTYAARSLPGSFAQAAGARLQLWLLLRPGSAAGPPGLSVGGSPTRATAAPDAAVLQRAVLAAPKLAWESGSALRSDGAEPSDTVRSALRLVLAVEVRGLLSASSPAALASRASDKDTHIFPLPLTPIACALAMLAFVRMPPRKEGGREILRPGPAERWGPDDQRLLASALHVCVAAGAREDVAQPRALLQSLVDSTLHPGYPGDARRAFARALAAAWTSSPGRWSAGALPGPEALGALLSVLKRVLRDGEDVKGVAYGDDPASAAAACWATGSAPGGVAGACLTALAAHPALGPSGAASAAARAAATGMPEPTEGEASLATDGALALLEAADREDDAAAALARLLRGAAAVHAALEAGAPWDGADGAGATIDGKSVGTVGAVLVAAAIAASGWLGAGAGTVGPDAACRGFVRALELGGKAGAGGLTATSMTALSAVASTAATAVGDGGGGSLAERRRARSAALTVTSIAALLLDGGGDRRGGVSSIPDLTVALEAAAKGARASGDVPLGDRVADLLKAAE